MNTASILLNTASILLNTANIYFVATVLFIEVSFFQRA